MKELILWKQVDDENEQGEPGTVYFKVDTMPDGIWLKRVVINILSDQEIEDLSCKGLDKFDAKLFKCNDCDDYERDFKRYRQLSDKWWEMYENQKSNQ